MKNRNSFVKILKNKRVLYCICKFIYIDDSNLRQDWDWPAKYFMNEFILEIIFLLDSF